MLIFKLMSSYFPLSGNGGKFGDKYFNSFGTANELEVLDNLSFIMVSPLVFRSNQKSKRIPDASVYKYLISK